MEHFGSLAIPASHINQIVARVCWWCPQCYQEILSQHMSRALQLHRSTHQILTIELPSTHGLSFLDTLTKPTLSSTESTVYRKPNHTDRYLDYNSNHPISAKLSVIHTLIHRAKQVCSTPEFHAKEMDHLCKVLQDNHYPTVFTTSQTPTESQSHQQESS